jgi:trehalose synthase
MIDLVTVEEGHTLAAYGGYPELATTVHELEDSATQVVRRLNGRTVWMVNSTAHGGGVAEMMPVIVSLLRQLGVRTEWAVIRPHDGRFFPLTKRLHNLLHGAGEPNLGPDDRAFYESVSRRLADECRSWVAPEDLLVINDPQPLGMGGIIKKELGVRAIWRSHIGLKEETRATREVWEFLMPWLGAYDRTVFSLGEYVPSLLSGRADIIYPTIDPLDDKNRELSKHELISILTSAALAATTHPSLNPPFDAPALRLQRDGSFAPATQPEDLGLLFRPIVTQISRWDHLKGFVPLLQGFSLLVLAGPDPEGSTTIPRPRRSSGRSVRCGEGSPPNCSATSLW